MGAEASLTMYGNTSVSTLHEVAIIIILYSLGTETTTRDHLARKP